MAKKYEAIVKNILLFWAAFGLGCFHSDVRPYDYSKEPDPRKMEFVLGPSDLLRITVWKNPELSTEAAIRPDGTVTMPLIGDIQAVGKTPHVLRDEITQRLGAYIKENTPVTVAVIEVNSYRFTVSGNVEHAGMYNSRHYVTTAEALALAGGLNRFAAPDRIVIVRTDAKGKVRQIPINYNDVNSGLRPEQNIVLLAGDQLFVP